MLIRKHTLCLLLFSLAASPSLTAQDGVSSMSMGMSRAGVFPSFNEIRIEEFINYHRHQLPLPREDRRVRLDLRWGHVTERGPVLQVGLATPRSLDRETMPPLNLVLVIDRSGSMSGDRIENVKKALRQLVEHLRGRDLVTIVGFSRQARVELAACHKTSQADISAAIEGLQAGGSTNLHAGLMLGYAEALAHYDPEKSNRVIVLSDGIANQGVTDPGRIAAESSRFNRKGIDLSTIGLGHDFNHELLRELADAGRGLIHFVDDSKDIEKTFIREVDSLLVPAAKRVRLRVDAGRGNARVKVFGYDPDRDGSQYSFKLDDLNHGATQVVLFQFRDVPRTPVTVKLKYIDALSGQNIQLEETTSCQEFQPQGGSEQLDLRKNFAIAVIADAIKQSLKLVENEEFQKAEQRLRKGVQFARRSDLGPDEDLRRMITIAKDYQKRIDSALSLAKR